MRRDRPTGTDGRAPSRKAPVGFTMVEMVVTLAVVSLLMIGVVAFLVNGMVSAQKTTAINDTTVKGRYIFEHISREMARSKDLAASNFSSPNGGGTAYSTFNYRIAVGSGGTVTSGGGDISSITTVTVQMDAPTPPDLLVPQVGDYVKLPFPNLG
jgi:prepilin-type N-terminal cleavage/methylation domain-containing protein